MGIADGQPVRVAAAGDLHADEGSRSRIRAAFRALRDVDLVLLAGDLTTYGAPSQARIVAGAAGLMAAPVLAVLGNHDWHTNRRDEVVAELENGGVRVLDPGWEVLEVRGVRVGVVGVKGFVGGFPDARLPDFGEPLLRGVYAAASEEVAALEEGLEAVAGCDVRIVLLHYAPTSTTLEGEPRVLWLLLGTDRLAEPIERHGPELVLHGHGHFGRFDGSIGAVPVYNVAIPVMGSEFSVFELDPADRRLRAAGPA